MWRIVGAVGWRGGKGGRGSAVFNVGVVAISVVAFLWCVLFAVVVCYLRAVLLLLFENALGTYVGNWQDLIMSY